MLLSAVYKDGAYSNIELDKLDGMADRDRAYITKLFYGVLENEIRYSYAISRLTKKAPKASIKILLKMGMYQLEFMRTPAYAVLDKTVDLAKKLGKSGVSSFINAVLRRFTEFCFPQKGETSDSEYLSLKLGVPLWISEKLIAKYGVSLAETFYSFDDTRTHIRFKIGKIIDKTLDMTQDVLGLGYYVTHSIMTQLKDADFTAQSMSSMVAVHGYLAAYNACIKGDGRYIGKSPSILDVCSAPGGKSVYLKELLSSSMITACDTHPHRAKLIESYARRMGVSLCIKVRDARVYNSPWQDAFDMVVCDVPCTGTGVLTSKPDIILNRTSADIGTLIQTQKIILETSSRYVRPGGCICYSTCSVLEEENDSVWNDFLTAHTDFESIDLGRCEIGKDVLAVTGQQKEPCIRMLPDKNGFDGFFVAAAKRKEI